MARRLPQWNKDIKKELIQRDMTVTDLSSKMGVTREWLSSIINNRVIAPEMARKIGMCLGIPYPDEEEANCG